MWFWTGVPWQFVSLAGQWTTTTTTWRLAPRPTTTTTRPTTIHEMPIGVAEYVARIREKCD